MFTKLFALAGLSAVAIAYFSQQKAILPIFLETWDDKWDDSCLISKSTAFEIFDGPNRFSTSPTEHLDSVKITPAINASNWEQWEFDGVSETGMSGILMGFSRDYSYHFFGQGNLRVEFYINLADGSIIQELDYVAESAIIECEDFILGIFNSTKKSYTFHITKDFKHVKLNFNSPKLHGTMKISSTVPPVYADGTQYGSKEGKADSAELSPGLFYSLPIPAGRMEVDITMSSGKRISFGGLGGHTRLWAHEGWLKICDGWHLFRAFAGPYSIIYWDVASRINRGAWYFAGHLFYDDQLVAASRIGKVSTKDYILFNDTFGGELSGKLADKNTGHILEFVSPARDRKWRFEMQHMVKQYEMGIGSGLGLTGFGNWIKGGEVGELQYEGKGIGEQTWWPEYIAEWKIWIVYGIGFLGEWKHYLMQMVGYLF